MHLFDQRILGLAILILLGMLVAVKRVATGNILDAPSGGLLVRLVNVFNLIFLLLVNPLAATLMLTRNLAAIDPIRLTIHASWVWTTVEIAGAALYAAGYLVMASALIALGRNYQLGGCAPRAEDRIVTEGPYNLVRHPMYTGALSISLGLALLTQSWAFLGVFCIYCTLFIPLIPLEEKGLREAYGEPYGAYRRKTRKLIPLIY